MDQFRKDGQLYKNKNTYVVFICVNMFNPYNNSVIIAFILQIRKLKHKKIE